MNDGDANPKVLITRPEVARRQLDAAILMFFRGDDELAVHAVAQGAFQIIRDLLAQQRKDAIEVYMTRGFFEVLKAHANGQLPSSVGETFEKIIRQVPPALLEAIRDRSYEDMKVTLTGFDTVSFWSRYKKQYNMLKHADKDSSVPLDPTSLNNTEVLIQAIGGYVELCFPLSTEMETFYFYWCCLHPELFHASEPEHRCVTGLKQHRGRDRLEACRFIIGDPLLKGPDIEQNY